MFFDKLKAGLGTHKIPVAGQMPIADFFREGGGRESFRTNDEMQATRYVARFGELH